MKNFSCSILPLALVCFSIMAKAQSREFSYPEWNIRTSLTSWFDYDAGLMLGVGYRWSDRFSVAVEPTWIIWNTFQDDFENKSYPSGIKIRCDLKIYPGKTRKRKFDFFLAPELHYKFVKTQKYARFGINCMAGTCAYFQNAYYTQVKKEWGGLFKIGINCMVPFVRDPRFLFEIYSGVGGKSRQFRETNLPEGGSFDFPPQRGIFRSRVVDEPVGVPLFPFGLKLVYIVQRPF